MRTIVKALSTLATKLVAGSLSGLHTDPDGNLWVAGLDVLAHPPSAPVTLCTSLILPAGNVKTNANAGTAG